MSTPWCDCKVAFGIENADPFDDSKLFNAAAQCTGAGPSPLPDGWELNEIDGTGARYVAVFRINVMPTVEDGRKVKRWLRKIGCRPG